MRNLKGNIAASINATTRTAQVDAESLNVGSNLLQPGTSND